MFEHYIPQYFEDDAPVFIMMSDTLMYTPGDEEWRIYDVREVPAEYEDSVPSCGVLSRSFYIGANGMVAPCMGMCDCSYATNFPNLFETPLRDILRESTYTELTRVSVGDVRKHNPKCRNCKYLDRCTGGCRNSVLLHGDDYYAIDEGLCYFFENGWEERIRKAAEEPFKAYLERNPPKPNQGRPLLAREDCP